jgi:hypothetical protein
MEVICSSETSVHTRSTWRHIPEDSILHSHRHENLRSYKSSHIGQIWEFYIAISSRLDDVIPFVAAFIDDFL